MGLPPTLSVLLPVRNAAPFLEASVTSILNQTKRDFEFIILDDASTDGSTQVLQAWAARDSRIRLLRSETHLGVVGAANRVLLEARGEVCARMDADDLCDPARLAVQWAVLDEHPEASLVGTLWRGMDPRGRLVRPSDRWRLLRRSTFAPFPHGSVMFRRAWALTIGGYRPQCAGWEDLDFFVRLSSVGPIYVVARPLYTYRFHATMETATRAVRRVEQMYKCTDRVGQGEEYASVLSVPPDEAAPPTDPRAIRTLASPRLWAGERPGIPAAWRSTSSWRPWSVAVQTVILGTWGELSPKSLRATFAAMIKARDVVASTRIRPDDVVRWTPRPEAVAHVSPTLATDSLGK
jgi:hypothetical protein